MAKLRTSGVHENYQPNPVLHRHLHHEILIIEKGGGVNQIDEIEYPVLDNQIFFLRPGQLHRFNPDKDAKFYFLAIDNDKIQLHSTIKLKQFEYFQSFYDHRYIRVKNIAPYKEIILNIKKELYDTTEHLNQEVLVASYLSILLIKLQREFLDSPTNINQKDGYSDLVARFNQLLDDPNITYRFVKDYANILFVSPNYLNQKVSSETGTSAGTLIEEKISLEARRFLIQSTEPILKIAKQLNFPNATHFSRFFKRQTGVTPQDYRDHRIKKLKDSF